MGTYGYVRVSTLRQAEEGLSLEVQRRQLEGYALQHGLTLDRVFRLGHRRRERARDPGHDPRPGSGPGDRHLGQDDAELVAAEPGRRD